MLRFAGLLGSRFSACILKLGPSEVIGCPRTRAGPHFMGVPFVPPADPLLHRVQRLVGLRALSRLRQEVRQNSGCLAVAWRKKTKQHAQGLLVQLAVRFILAFSGSFSI